jgi:hypothetical protein
MSLSSTTALTSSIPLSFPVPDLSSGHELISRPATTQKDQGESSSKVPLNPFLLLAPPALRTSPIQPLALMAAAPFEQGLHILPALEKKPEPAMAGYKRSRARHETVSLGEEGLDAVTRRLALASLTRTKNVFLSI